MSRWNKSGSNRFQQTVVPLDNLMREKENKNSVAVGTVMKFGMMQFTSIRSSCYNMGALNSTSPIQNSASSPTSPDLNDTKISVETTPKPRKFFKSRNSAGAAEIQQQIALQQQMAMQQHQTHNNHIPHPSSSDEQSSSPQKQNKGKKVSPKKEKKEKIEKPKIEKPPKIKKEKPPKPPKEPKRKPKAEPVVAEEGEQTTPSRRNRALIEPSRSSNRARGKINYNEDLGEEEFLMRTEKRIAPKTLKELQQEQAEEEALLAQQTISEAAPIQEESPIVHHQTNPSTEVIAANQSQIAHPPIVLRISKGTSRLVSTDNEDGVKSPHTTGGNSSSDENKNVVNNTALESTDELIAVLSGETAVPQAEPEQKPERIRIRIKKDYIRSYNDSLREQEAARAKTEELQQIQQIQSQQSNALQSEPSEVSTEQTNQRVTRRRGKNQEKEVAIAPRISPIVSEFDSQSSVLGSISSQNTTGSLSSNVIPSREDCKVIHSRSSSVVTSDFDTSQPSSLAAAPPSSENFSSNNGSQDEVPSIQPQKGRRGRKKAVPEVKEVEMKPPEPVVMEKPAARTRNTRNSKAQVNKDDAITSPETSPTKSETPSPEKRSTRNTRHNNINNIASQESVVEAAPVIQKPSRKRKNVEPQPIPEEMSLNSSIDDDQTAALNLSQRSLTLNTSISSNASIPSSDSSAPPVTEYKHKKLLVKRSWESEKSSPMEVDQAPSMAQATRSSPNKQYNNNHLQNKQDGSENNNPGVKLLISKKKGSIFKSRALDKDEDNNKKRLNLYKHTWDEDAEMTDKTNNASDKAESLNTSTNSGTTGTFFDGEPSGITRFSRHKKTENNITESIADDFDEDDMPLAGMNSYQVVRNVKKAHQIQESGEFQEMDDDVEYLLDALQPNSQVALRCLSALQLASKCMTPSFRMHIRAHGIVPKFFKALEDAPNDPSLGLCTAMVMFALSQDTLKMDLDRGSLELMLNLLECEANQKQYPKDIVMNKQHMERKQKVRELCEEIQSQGKSIHLNLDNITAAQLAMESLLSLTSKRAGEWLKEDLRELGGIEHIIKTVCECCNQITEYVEEWTEPLLEKLSKIGRCLRIVENVTSNNEENQKYILHYKSQVFVRTLCRFYNLLSSELTLYPTTEKSAKDFAGVAIRETLLTLLKVIVNLTHPFNERAIGSVLFGDFREIFQISISSLLFGVSYVSSRFQFDFSLLTLVLLSNLTQLNEKNRQSIMQLSIPVEEFGKEKQPAIKSLIEYFYKCTDKAKTLKKLTDDLIDNSKQRDAKQEEAVNALIQNSGTHMENTILGSFMSTLLGFVIMNNHNNEAIARRYLRDGKFDDMVAVLMQYYEFLNLTVSADASSMAQVKTIKNVMDYLRNCDVE